MVVVVVVEGKQYRNVVVVVVEGRRYICGCGGGGGKTIEMWW